jgi:predicted enzyme related to lactoylglutathione lyase
MSQSAHGRFVWYDLMTTDPVAAKAFYNQLVGWGTKPWQESGPPYTMWIAGSEAIGGVMDLPKEAADAGAPPNWIAYIAVSDIEVVCERATELGGVVLHPATDIPGAGCFAILQDPQGAVFAVYASDSLSDDPPQQPGIGQISWHELATSDFAAGYDFYCELFGWESKEDMDMGGGWMYRIYGQPESFPLGGMFTKPAEMPGPPMWLYYISVPSVTEAVARVKELGGKVLNGPMEVPGGDMIAQCMDPQGAVFALHSRAAGGDSA